MSKVLSWVKQNIVIVVGISTAVALGILLGGKPDATILNMVGRVVAAVALTGYVLLFLFGSLDNSAYLKRLIPGLIVLVGFAACIVMKVAIPDFISSGMNAGAISIYIAAIISRMVR